MKVIKILGPQFIIPVSSIDCDTVAQQRGAWKQFCGSAVLLGQPPMSKATQKKNFHFSPVTYRSYFCVIPLGFQCTFDTVPAQGDIPMLRQERYVYGPHHHKVISAARWYSARGGYCCNQRSSPDDPLDQRGIPAMRTKVSGSPKILVYLQIPGFDIVDVCLIPSSFLTTAKFIQ